MIPDAFITDLRAKVTWELPWPLPATVLQMTDEDLDRLWWRVRGGG